VQGEQSSNLSLELLAYGIVVRTYRVSGHLEVVPNHRKDTGANEIATPSGVPDVSARRSVPLSQIKPG
jgi:hypothetical protein